MAKQGHEVIPDILLEVYGYKGDKKRKRCTLSIFSGGKYYSKNAKKPTKEFTWHKFIELMETQE